MDGTDPRQIQRSCRSSRAQLAQIMPEILRAASDPGQLAQLIQRSCSRSPADPAGRQIYTATLTNTYTERLAQLQILLDKTRRRSHGRSV